MAEEKEQNVAAEAGEYVKPSINHWQQWCRRVSEKIAG